MKKTMAEGLLSEKNRNIEQLNFIQSQLGTMHQQIEAGGYNVRPEILDNLLKLTDDIKMAIENMRQGIGLPPGITYDELLRRADLLLLNFGD